MPLLCILEEDHGGAERKEGGGKEARWGRAEKRRRIKTGNYLIEEREESLEARGEGEGNNRGRDPVLILYICL